MRKFLDLIYFGCYYVLVLEDKVIDAILHPLFRSFAKLMEKIPCVNNRCQRVFNMTFVEYSESIINNMRHDEFMRSMHDLYIGMLLGPLFILFGANIRLIIWHLCGKSYDVLHLNKTGELLFVFGFPILMGFLMPSILYWNNDRDKIIIKKYKKKPQKEHYKALLAFIGSYVIMIFLFCQLHWHL